LKPAGTVDELSRRVLWSCDGCTLFCAEVVVS
jgi:hypothetical protein